MTGFEADRLNHAPLSPEEERVLATAAPAAPDDDHAFGRLYDAYLPRIYAYVGYRLPAEDVEDVVAETFVKMARGLRRFRWRGLCSLIVRKAAQTFAQCGNRIFVDFVAAITMHFKSWALGFNPLLVSWCIAMLVHYVVSLATSPNSESTIRRHFELE